MKAAIEGLIFISGDEGITKEQLISILEISFDDLNKYLNELIDDYNNNDRGMQIKLFGNVIKMMTKEIHKEYYQKLANLDDETILSQGALETLAIIAYNGPITRVAVDQIRGVNTSYLIRKLLDRDFIKDVGRSDAPGRPTLYEISDKFLDYFGLSSLEELPKINVDTTEEEIDLFSSKYTEES
ncbi:MAG: SMC-Scp complex subunit ScpB [Bacilli bacterium]|nr:SMC-Scp complex subunit ScpB [Bacilli bacterium]